MNQLLRQWDDHELRWSKVSARHWRAYFNNIQIGGYSAEMLPVYVYFGNTRFQEPIQTEIEARQLIQKTFSEWLVRAVREFGETING